MKISELQKIDKALYNKVMKLTKKYSGKKVLHMSSKHMLDTTGNLHLSSSKIYSDHERIDKVVIPAAELADLNKLTNVSEFRARLDKLASFQLFCREYAAANGLANHTREHSHCFRRVARALGRPDLYKHMLFGKTQKALAPVTLGKIRAASKAKTSKLVKVRKARKVRGVKVTI